MPNKTIPAPILFIVEGETDKKIVPHFFKDLNLKKEVKVLEEEVGVNATEMPKASIDYEEMKGWKQFEAYLTQTADTLAARLDNENLDALILLVDGDDADPTERTRTLIDIILKNKKLSKRNFKPKEDYQFNILDSIIINDKRIYFGIYIIQGKNENGSYSDLESLVLNNSKQKRRKHFDLVDNFGKHFKQVLGDEAPQKGAFNKALWHIYLALCWETRGLGVNEKYLLKLLPQCFELSLETDNMNVLKQCYEDLKRIMNQDITVNENA